MEQQSLKNNFTSLSILPTVAQMGRDAVHVYNFWRVILI